jgi:hypothetical protein
MCTPKTTRCGVSSRLLTATVWVKPLCAAASTSTWGTEQTPSPGRVDIESQNSMSIDLLLVAGPASSTMVVGLGSNRSEFQGYCRDSYLAGSTELAIKNGSLVKLCASWNEAPNLKELLCVLSDHRSIAQSTKSRSRQVCRSSRSHSGLRQRMRTSLGGGLIGGNGWLASGLPPRQRQGDLRRRYPVRSAGLSLRRLFGGA